MWVKKMVVKFRSFLDHLTFTVDDDITLPSSLLLCDWLEGG